MLWSKNDLGIIQIGFTDEALKKLGKLSVTIPRVEDKNFVAIGTMLLSSEGSRCLTGFKSPVAGQVVYINTPALNLPTTITKDTVLFEVRP